MTAIWTTPITWFKGQLITADIFNQQLRDNLDWLKTPAGGSAIGSSDISTTSGTLVDMTNMSVTLTVVGSRLLVFFEAPIRADAARVLTLAIAIDGSLVVSEANKFNTDTAARHAFYLIRVGSVTPGSRAVTNRWATSGGTIYQDGATQAPRRFSVHEVT